MAIKRNRKNKENPHYNFMVSWQPSEARVKGEMKLGTKSQNVKLSSAKRADILAQDNKVKAVKKDLVKSLITISLILILELVIYLARNKFAQ